MTRIIERIRQTFVPTDVVVDRRFGAFEAGVLLVAAVGLTVMQFGGSEMTYLSWFGDTLATGARERLAETVTHPAAIEARHHPFYDLLGLVHWSIFCVIGYVLVPSVYLWAAKRRVRDMYLGAGDLGRHLPVYLSLFVLVMLPVFIVSYSPSYQNIYPFYKHAGRSVFDLVAWELAYGLQFFALEFMFRGFLLEGLRRWLGYGAVFVMVVPYCMLHFQKTGSESIGAVVAGVILGSLAMKYRSIWGGVIIHWMVAISMDVLSLVHRGILPTRLWPE